MRLNGTRREPNHTRAALLPYTMRGSFLLDAFQHILANFIRRRGQNFFGKIFVLQLAGNIGVDATWAPNAPAPCCLKAQPSAILKPRTANLTGAVI